MSLITTRLRQDAVYWPCTGVDKFGQPTYGAAVAIKVRWVDKQDEFLTPEGTKELSNAVVYTDRQIPLKGALFLGKVASVPDPANPRKNKGVWEVRQQVSNPNFRNTEKSYTCYL